MRSRSCLGDVRNPNPNPKPDSTYPVMDAKSLFALCRLVAYPLLYRDKKSFGEARDIQKTVDWLFGLDGFGGSAGQPSPPRRISAAEWHSDASEWVVPQEHTHRPEDFEYTALAIAHRLIKHMVSMIADTLPFEHGWESIRLRYLFLRDDLIRAFTLADNELANLELGVGNCGARNSSISDSSKVFV